MSLSDPIADMLTRIRNANTAVLKKVQIPHSKMKSEIARILKKEGFISDYTTEGQGVKKVLVVYLKYVGDDETVIKGLQRVSKPSLRRYVAATEVPRVLGGLGVAILSTSAGIMTGRDARKKNVGGEVLCTVW